MINREMKLIFLWCVIFFGVLLWSGILPKDRFTWFLEVIPAVIGFVILAMSYRSFQLTPLLYGLILIHCIILMVGGHYTYAEVPLFDRLAEWWGSERNAYDKLGHFAQGFVPAIIAREIFIRKQVIVGENWRTMMIVSVCLAFSAFYELLEWWVAVATGEDADAFLGSQGYIWDTQSDMGFALVGVVVSLLLLSRWHDRQLSAIPL